MFMSKLPEYHSRRADARQKKRADRIARSALGISQNIMRVHDMPGHDMPGRDRSVRGRKVRDSRRWTGICFQLF
jgi:hypothetical protein